MRPDMAPALTIRDALPEDLPALVALSKKTFSDKFARLYNPEDLAAFLEESHGEANYRKWLADPDVLVRVAEDETGALKAYLLCSPLALPAENPKPGAVELASAPASSTKRSPGPADAERRKSISASSQRTSRRGGCMIALAGRR